MNRKTIFTLLLTAVCSTASAQITGRVFEDRNSNGRFDPLDRAIVGAAVSDGLAVVKSDRVGQFSILPREGAKFLFVTAPSGYVVGRGAKHYLQIADGVSVDYDFALVPSKIKVARDGSHSFIHITDTEISTEVGHELFVEGVRGYAADQNAAFIVHTGDICYEKGLNAHIKMMNDTNMGMPVRYCIGNHDYVDGEYGEALFEQNYGPIYYSFEVGNTHYIVTPMAYGDRKPHYDAETLYQWLANDLAAMRDGMSVVIFNHDLQCRDGKFIYGNVELLKHNLKAWVYGHWHINHVKYFGDVATISTSADKGGIDHSAATFRRINVDEQGRVTSQLIYPYVDESLVAVQSVMAEGCCLSVNGYNSVSPIVSITASYSVGQRKMIVKMGRTTDWNWRVMLPQGAENILVEAKFNNGKSRVASVQSRPTADSSLKIEWNTNVGSNIYMSSPIVWQGNLYVGVVDEAGAGGGGVVCLNAKTGERLWKFATRNSVKNAIAVAAGRLFAQDAQGYLYAIDAKNGKLVWEQKMAVADPLPSIVEGLAVRGDRLYAGSGKGLAAYDFDGNVVWKNDDWAQNEGTISTFGFTDDLILTSSQWQALFANDLRTGKMVWRADKSGIRFRASTPVVRNGVIYLLSQNSLFVLNEKSGEVIVQKKLPYNVEVGSTPLFVGGTIVFGTTDAGIQTLDAETLEPRWVVATGAGLIYTAPYYRYPVSNIESSPLATASGNVIIGTADGVIRVIDPKSGVVLDSLNVGAPILTTFAAAPMVMHHTLRVASPVSTYFVADYAGNVYCLRTAL